MNDDQEVLLVWRNHNLVLPGAEAEEGKVVGVVGLLQSHTTTITYNNLKLGMLRAIARF